LEIIEENNPNDFITEQIYEEDKKIKIKIKNIL
jgi:hypothetical protein